MKCDAQPAEDEEAAFQLSAYDPSEILLTCTVNPRMTQTAGLAAQELLSKIKKLVELVRTQEFLITNLEKTKIDKWKLLKKTLQVDDEWSTDLTVSPTDNKEEYKLQFVFREDGTESGAIVVLQFSCPKPQDDSQDRIGKLFFNNLKDKQI